MKKYIPILILCCVLASCGKQDSSSNPTTQNIETEAVDTKDLDALLLSIKEKRIDQNIGLSSLSQLIDNSQYSDQELKRVAELLTEISGDFEKNLALVMGIENSKLIDIQTLSQVFVSLVADLDNISISTDKVLIKTLVLRNAEYRSQNTQYYPLDEMQEYFDHRIAFLLDNEYSATEIIEDYAMLTDVLPANRSNALINLLPQVELSEDSSISMRMLYTDLLLYGLKSVKENLINSNPVLLLKNTKTNAKWALNNLQKYQGYADESLKIISSYLSSFDQVVKIENLDGKYFSKMVDERTVDIMMPLLEILKTNLREDPFSNDSLKTNSIHPYLKLYVNKAILSEKASTFHYANELLDSYETFETAFYKNLRVFLQKEINYESKKEIFVKNYYNVELKKLFLETKSTFAGIVKENSDERLSIYKDLVKDLVATLNFIYDKDYKITDIKRQHFATNLYEELNLDYELSEHGSFVKNYCRTRTNCEKVKLAAGIYVIPQMGDQQIYNLQMYGDEIEFHPLSMLLAPGSTVELNFNKISNAWIDVSGFDGETQKLDYEHREIKLPTIKQTLNEKKGDKETTYYNRDWKLDGNKPAKVKNQLHASKGTSAGKIIINQTQGEFNNFQLFASFGGNGANGEKGISTKLKTNISINISHDQSKIFSKNSCLSQVKLTEVIQRIKNEKECRSGPVGREGNGNSEEKCEWKTDYNRITKNDITITINKSRGGNGGDAGNGSNVVVKTAFKSEYSHLLKNHIVAPGKPGMGGAAGECGAGADADFHGIDGKNGEIK